ncbi:MAG: HAD-IA family hydrolase [Succinivibrionaceae bacterium]|nr:HAD-IA family hydrolase [Succinivibrionaceae bacterium]
MRASENGKIRLFIFDLDGTLAATGPQIAKSVISAMKLIGLAPPSVEEILHYIGNGAEKLLKRSMINRFDYDPEQIDQEVYRRLRLTYRDEYMKLIGGDFSLYPGVRETLERLKACGKLLAIASNKPDMYIRPWLEAAKLEDLFDYAMGSEVIPEVKPDPAVLLHVCRQLSVEPSEAVMVGDSANDILAARAAGMRSVGMTYGYCYVRPIEDYTPDHVFDDFRELQKLATGA